MVVAVFRVDLKLCLLQRKLKGFTVRVPLGDGLAPNLYDIGAV